ncbi:MAG: hypothetical protein P8N76_20490 [Pirellulaceae bacterium]|nr:hypothetical protein [Pirellulaceae bacterium]
MNRTLGFGLALFFAILSIAVLGNGTEATAGSDCGGCHADSGCNGGCGGWFKHRNRCHGGLFRHLRGCHSSCSGSNCSGSSCHSSDDCHSSKDCGGCHSRRCHGGLFARLKARRCHGRCHGNNDCCGVVETKCCGTAADHGCHGDDAHHHEAAPAKEAPSVPDAPAEGSASKKSDSKVVYRSVVYRK